MADTVEEPGARLRVATATSRDEREAVARLRYRVYVDEMGKQPPNADHGRKMLADDMDDVATILYVSDGDDVVATLRHVWARNAPGSRYESIYGLVAMPEVSADAISFTSRLIIAPERRHTHVIGQLLNAIYELGRRNGLWLDFINCEPRLVGLYEAMGYRRFRPTILEDHAGLWVPLALVADDVDYLARIQSPLARLAPRFANDPMHGRWFAGRFAEYAQPSCARLMGADEFWSYLTARIHVDEHPLLHGLGQEEARRILNSGTILRVKTGQGIVRAGDPGSDMFMVLSGAVEVRATASDGMPRIIETLGKGQVFGEMSFLNSRPRTADVTALSDVELLALNREFLERIGRAAPEAANRVLLNLAMFLTDRLQATTRNLVERTPGNLDLAGANV